jgi:hypothetical protein
VKASVDDLHLVTDAQGHRPLHLAGGAAGIPAERAQAANLCRVSTTDTHNVWQVTNVSGGRGRTFHAGVTYDGKTT